jgi:mycoredoxin
MAKLELFGSRGCPYTTEMREWLEWRRVEFVEYDIQENYRARERLRILTGGQCAVPVLVNENKIVQIGWRGRSCIAG